METLQKCIIDIKQILLQAQQKAYQATAFAMIEGFWRIGRRIVEKGLANEHFGTIRSSILLFLTLKIVHTCVSN